MGSPTTAVVAAYVLFQIINSDADQSTPARLDERSWTFTGTNPSGQGHMMYTETSGCLAKGKSFCHPP